MPWVGLQCVIVVFSDHSHLFLSLSKFTLYLQEALGIGPETTNSIIHMFSKVKSQFDRRHRFHHNRLYGIILEASKLDDFNVFPL